MITTFQPTLEVTNAGDPDGDPLTYEFQLYADESMTTPITSREGVIEEWDGTTGWRVTKCFKTIGPTGGGPRPGTMKERPEVGARSFPLP
jgi:hypothetical protein